MKKVSMTAHGAFTRTPDTTHNLLAPDRHRWCPGYERDALPLAYSPQLVLDGAPVVRSSTSSLLLWFKAAETNTPI